MNTNKIAKIGFLFTGIILAILIIYRANILSFTHDESGTYLFYNHNTILELFTLPGVWTSANNHILNTLLYRASITLFGLNDFTMRLPNVLSFIVLFGFLLFFLFPKFKSKWAGLSIILILFVNPYVIEFYSLCRGYGLSMCFHFIALGLLWSYFNSKKTSHLYGAFFALILATLSLLTNAILIPIYGLALWIYFLRKKENRKHIILAPFISGLLALVLVGKPIYLLSQNNEFDFGVPNLWMSFRSLISQSTCNRTYLGDNTTVILTVTLILLISFFVIRGMLNKQVRFFALSFCILIVLLCVSYYALNIYFPSERKTTIYIPLIAILVGGLLNEIDFNKLKKGILLFCTGLFVFNFIDVINVQKSIEWYYDADTKKIAHLLFEKSGNMEVHLQSDWHFHPTLRYYITTCKKDNIELSGYNKDLDKNPETNAVVCYIHQVGDFDGFDKIYGNYDAALLLK